MNQIIIKDEEKEDQLNEFIDLNKKDFLTAFGQINLNANKLLEFNPKIYDELIEKPIDFIERLKNKILEKYDIKLSIHFFNINNYKEMHKIRAEDLGKFLSVKGIIKRATKIIPRVYYIHFECPSCGTIIGVFQEKKAKRTPQKCSCGARRGFKIIKEDFKDIQEVNLEESQESLDGKQPHQLRVYIEDYLTDSTLSDRLQPGRKVEVIGIIKRLPAFMNLKDEENNLSEFMMYANNIISLELDEDMKITEEDERQIREIACDNPLEKLSKSLSPEVYGNDVVKKAIVLQMMRGVPRPRSDGTMSREDIHILICGDVGIAKSVLLKSASIKTPRSKVIVGTRTSRVGLGAMCIKDELTNSWSLEIGALALCNKSTLMVDEIDKMFKENLSELLEPMSAGTITLNRAGISACLPARTSILAVANPVHGNYNLEQPLAKQIDLPTPIINRFDLIFVLIDTPSADFDRSSVAHVFNSYQEKRKSEISLNLFKKYINYCRKLEPSLDPNLLANIQDFYVTIRQRSNKDGEKGLPINLRNIEGIIRIAEAHAKIRLSKIVELEDLKIAKEIFMFCLKQIGIDNETGLVDTSKLTERIPISRKGKIEEILNIINHLSERFGKIVPYGEIEREAECKGIKKWEILDFLDRLKQSGEIFEPTKQMYQIF